MRLLVEVVVLFSYCIIIVTYCEAQKELLQGGELLLAYLILLA